MKHLESIPEGFVYSAKAKKDLRARAARARNIIKTLDKETRKRINHLIKVANEDR